MSIEVFVCGLLEAVHIFLDKLGEFVRELAALVLVFIPLDLWKNEITWGKVVIVFAASAILFLVGVICAWLAHGVTFGKHMFQREIHRVRESRA